jgi:hypothetical protein
VIEHIPRSRNPRYPKRTLVLDGQEVCIAGKNKKLDIFCKCFMKKKFPEPLKLGTLRTDGKGRLIVLGGHGFSGSLIGVGLGKPGDNFANNSGWYDDTSDGSIRATVTWQKRNSFPKRAKGAWVIVASPKYAPSLHSVITLYDTLYQVALDKHLLERKRHGPHLFRRRYLPFRGTFTRSCAARTRCAGYSLELKSDMRKKLISHTSRPLVLRNYAFGRNISLNNFASRRTTRLNPVPAPEGCPTYGLTFSVWAKTHPPLTL